MAENKIMIYNAIKQTSFISINDSVIEVSFNSYSSQHEFQEVQQKFLDILRPKVQNFYISFSHKVIENKDVNYILSKDDIFKSMITKNPIILNLKEDLGLII